MTHTILGAGGSIANALTYELLKSNEKVRLVSRSGYSIPGTETCVADVTSYRETVKSVQGSQIVYLCIGLPYDSKIWAELWPVIMKNTIDACKEVNAKLVFFDNVYMYGKVDGKMIETTPYNPCSVKGEIRAKIAMSLQNEMAHKNIDAIIARAADLYGPYAGKTSLPYVLVFDKLIRGKKAQWLVDDQKLHSYTHTIDAAKGMYLLAKNNECFNQVWHLPTYNPALNGEEFIDMVAKELQVNPDYSILRKWMVKTYGIFDKTIAEAYEMLYQSEYDYYFDSTKFNENFKFQPTNYVKGINETIQYLNTVNSKAMNN